ncbi:VWA domain-containing protein [Sphingomonas sp. ASV193]|uniref:VWA domain-containing protein n=1 Tax=Sphingomonas sp. ASV193 TaxID=3144405 RepID=UPI0032E8F805
MNPDARLAMRLLAGTPGLGGAVLRGAGRDEWLAELRALLPPDAPWRRLPPHIDQERLTGGIDLAASLSSGRPVRETGLLEQAEGGVIVVPMAERLDSALAGQLAQRLDAPGAPLLILLDDGTGEEEAVASALLDRLAFHLDLDADEQPHHETSPTDEPFTAIAALAAAFGIDSVRALNFAARVARAGDLAAAARLVLAPRAIRLPEPAPPPPPEPGSAEGERDADESNGSDEAGERLVAATAAAIPPRLLAQLSGGTLRRARGSGAGAKARSATRGRPKGSRPGLPRGGARLALVDTIRAAAPWQRLRGATSSSLRIRKDDLRIRRFDQRAAQLTIFCVDASGSTAVARLADAKGAVERLLAQAYVTRSEVALIAFRGTGAELLLPPTRSLTRARRLLGALPGGGGSPLAAGIALTRQLAEGARAQGKSPLAVFLTDGGANIAIDGSAGRVRARDDAEGAAKALARSGVGALLIDIAPRPRAEAERLASQMAARYLPLPGADAAAIERAVAAA